MTLKLTFAVWNLSNSHTSWNVAQISYHGASRGPCACYIFPFVACKTVDFNDFISVVVCFLLAVYFEHVYLQR